MMNSQPIWKASSPQRISGRCLPYCLLTMALLTTSIGNTLFAQPKKIEAGDYLSLKFGASKKNSPTLVLGFRFCPAGALPEISDTDMFKFKPKPVELDGFWIAETELSQGDYKIIQQLVGGDKLPCIQELIERRGDKTELLVHSFKVDTKPVFALTIKEAVQIVQVLQANQLPGSSVSLKYAVRLPSYAEWQYACRAIQSDYDAAVTNSDIIAHRHFYAWPDNPRAKFNSLVKVREYSNLVDMFAREVPEDFDASQEQIIEDVRDSHEINDKRRNAFSSWSLHLMLNKKIGFVSTFGIKFHIDDPRELSRAEIFKAQFLQPVAARNKDWRNNWRLAHMHGNIAEWTIDHAAYAKNMGEMWRQLEHQLADAPHKTPGKKWEFHLAGGGFVDKTYTTFTIGGAYQIKNERAVNPDRMSWQLPGVRLVMTARLADAWQITMRAQALKALDEAAELDSIIKALVQERDAILEMSTLQANEQIDHANYYLSFARFQQDKKKGVLLESLKAYGDTLPDDSPTRTFLASTAQLIDDQPK